MKDVEALSDSRVCLGTGTLYGALKRLLEDGWIRRMDDGMEETGRQRKAYALTDIGQEILKTEGNRIEKLAAITRKRILEGSA